MADRGTLIAESITSSRFTPDTSGSRRLYSVVEREVVTVEETLFPSKRRRGLRIPSLSMEDGAVAMAWRGCRNQVLASVTRNTEDGGRNPVADLIASFCGSSDIDEAA